MFLGFLRGENEEFRDLQEFEEKIQEQNPGMSGTVPAGHGKHLVPNVPPDS